VGYVERHDATRRRAGRARVGCASLFSSNYGAATRVQSFPHAANIVEPNNYHFSSPRQVAADFQPFYPTLSTNIFATRWLCGSGDQLFIVINRSGKDVLSQPLLQVSAPLGSMAIDCYSGQTIYARTSTLDFAVSVAAEAAGFACVWIGGSSSAPSSSFLASMSKLTAVPLAELSNTWTAAHTVAPAHVWTPLPIQQPAGMVLVPGGVFNFTTNGIEIEGPDDFGVDFQFPWENITQRTHASVLHMPSLWVDVFPVTNSQWQDYVTASAYAPADATYYLHFWSKPGFNISGDDGRRPVTWVSPEEAAGAHARRVTFLCLRLQSH
jgi:iron(II)-dependent oxidoreductase